ncbi:hypothetical protein RX327_33140 [Bradyrhizobium sp. BEA-2-5]|uniref:hypothetical protein n=1 Tax=Bradyrhizobium sp. BEA-2-5 TaxID=3080015 RepID=UPI00293E3EF1|nr:hypothetical protein [Bradyrhizobium sp. BEA-2-5]WOH80565.1 hypothetical protein RX327_33140 [Bradyrhizobium sp. BEA-2-5]
MMIAMMFAMVVSTEKSYSMSMALFVDLFTAQAVGILPKIGNRQKSNFPSGQKPPCIFQGIIVASSRIGVSNHPNQVMIDTEFLTEKARDAIVAIDPYRKGFDVFKSELMAAEKAEAAPRDQATE